MAKVLGFDVGGANTKAAFINIKKGKIRDAKIAIEYFPIWKNPQNLPTVLLKLRKELTCSQLDSIGITMTAELSDAYQTKREGVNHILGVFAEVFPNVELHVLSADAKLESISDALNVPLKVAAANWAATGWLVSKNLQNSMVVDVGSTSTSIIPILNGQVSALGKTDLDKLLCGELVYSGSLRTNVATIVHSMPIRKGIASVSSETFALSGDIHLILGNISSGDYTNETADGRGKSVPESMARLARVICADTEMLSPQEIMNMARFIYNQQIRQITDGLTKVYAYVKARTSEKISVAVAGLGKDFLARKAAQSIGVDTIVDLGTILPPKAVLATPAYAVALMTAELIDGDVR